MSALLSMPEAICLESLLLLGLYGPDDQGTRPRGGADAAELELFLLLVFGRRVVDAVAAETSTGARYDQRTHLDLPLSRDRISAALELISWLKGGGGDTALLRERGRLDGLERSLRQATPNDPANGGPAPGLPHCADIVELVLARSDALDLLRALRRLHSFAETRSGVRLVGQQRIAGSYWRLYHGLADPPATRTEVRLCLPAHDWALLAHVTAYYLLNGATMRATDVDQHVDFVMCLDENAVLTQITGTADVWKDVIRGRT